MEQKLLSIKTELMPRRQKKISHVADGKVSKDSQDAVNGKQLYATNQRIDEMKMSIRK